MKKLLGPLERLYPMPCVLVVGGTMDEADALAVAWINVISSTPPTVAMGLRDSRRTLELIRATGDFTVNVPDSSLVAAVDYCGITSGKAEPGKIARAGLTLEESDVVTAPIIAECPYNLECKVIDNSVVVGSYVVVIGEIVQAHAEERILRPGTDIIEMEALDPLSYIAGAREYRAVGAKVADAYSIGKSLQGDAADA
jgi:flavin reductase (DIM6/NTAB) family NADH-FMN oxidoreductase RutF